MKQHELHSGWDEEHDCYIIDEDKVGRISDIAGFYLCLAKIISCVAFCNTVAVTLHPILYLGLLCRYAML